MSRHWHGKGQNRAGFSGTFDGLRRSKCPTAGPHVCRDAVLCIHPSQGRRFDALDHHLATPFTDLAFSLGVVARCPPLDSACEGGLVPSQTHPRVPGTVLLRRRRPGDAPRPATVSGDEKAPSGRAGAEVRDGVGLERTSDTESRMLVLTL